MMLARNQFFFGAALLLSVSPSGAAADDAALAQKAQAVLKANCYRCHGQEGAVEGGMNYILDVAKLVQRKKIVAGNPDKSPLYKKVVNNLMPPPDEKPRPSDGDKEILRRWIEVGAISVAPVVERSPIRGAEVTASILADLEKIEPRSRRFTRYFSIAHLHNAGLGDDELQTYRNALAKLVNSLSWHPRLAAPAAVDRAKTILRIDLRQYMWDANLWNRILADYPYGIFQDTADARAVSAATATRLPAIRADWFIATASRAPLYYDLLQTPQQVAELERQLRVDVLVNIQQERVARAGFNGSGISRNNRILERHDAVHGAYWRTYDFNEVPQNLTERQNLLPDRRNVFAYPLGPGNLENHFQHAGGEVIYNLPNGLHAYLLINANGVRLDKAPTAIVSDPKRPDRAVEAGLSCMSCHVRGINFKDDQVRDHVEKNPKAFSRSDGELIKALYVPKDKMKSLMERDAEQFKKAVEQTGAKVSTTESISTMVQRYEADLDLPTLAAEISLTPEELMKRLEESPLLARNFGSLKVDGGAVARQVLIQAFGDVVKDLRLGTLFQATQAGQNLPDNTGEVDPLEGRTSQANSMVFSADGQFALFGSADKTVRLWDFNANREIRRFVAHSASVWSVAVSADGKQALSGGADHSVRLWDVATGRELKRLDGHIGIVTALALAADGQTAVSAGYDQTVIHWDLKTGKELQRLDRAIPYINFVAIAPYGGRVLLAGRKVLGIWDHSAPKELVRLEGHSDAIVSLAIAADGKRALSGSDDGTMRLWDLQNRCEVRVFAGHAGPVKAVAFAPDGKRLVSGGADRVVRVWDSESGKELGRFDKHGASVICVAFTADGSHTISGSRDSVIKFWNLSKLPKTGTSP